MVRTEMKPIKIGKWLQDKMFQITNLVNDKIFHFDIIDDNELKLIKYHFHG